MSKLERLSKLYSRAALFVSFDISNKKNEKTEVAELAIFSVTSNMCTTRDFNSSTIESTCKKGHKSGERS